MTTATTPAVPNVLLIPATGAASTAPPASPWWLGVKRFLLQLAPLVPIIIDALIGLVQTGQVQVPSQWAAYVAIAIALYNATAKGLKEQRRQDAAATLAGYGLPVGEPLHPAALSSALYTDTTLPEARASTRPPAHG